MSATLRAQAFDKTRGDANGRARKAKVGVRDKGRNPVTEPPQQLTEAPHQLTEAPQQRTRNCPLADLGKTSYRHP